MGSTHDTDAPYTPAALLRDGFRPCWGNEILVDDHTVALDFQRKDDDHRTEIVSATLPAVRYFKLKNQVLRGTRDPAA